MPRLTSLLLSLALAAALGLALAVSSACAPVPTPPIGYSAVGGGGRFVLRYQEYPYGLYGAVTVFRDTRTGECYLHYYNGITLTTKETCD